MLQPREGMDCRQFIQKNFYQLNGKLYRPSDDSNCLVLALMKNDKLDMWEKLFKIKPETVNEETVHAKGLLDMLQPYFCISEPFELGENSISPFF